MGLVAKAFQDIITFSRASAGTYVNSNGYITNSSVLNYLTYSNQADNAAWTKSNSFVQTNLALYSESISTGLWPNNGVTTTTNNAIAPNGTLTASLMTGNGVSTTHIIFTSATATGSGGITASVYAKAGTNNFVQIFFGTDSVPYANFDVSSGTVGTVGSTTTASIQNVGNGWYRCIAYTTSTTANGMGIALISALTDARTPSNTLATSAYLWGAQLVQGSVPGDYRATTSAALPVLYADYNGVVRARKLCQDTATSSHVISQYATVVSGGNYTLTYKVKSGENTWAAVGTVSLGGTGYTYFNLSTGTIGTVLAGHTAAIVSLGNGWYQCSITGVSSATAVGSFLQPTTGDGVNTYTGNGSSGIYIADAQLNDGSSATAYYDTTASAYNAPRFDYDPVTLAAKGLLIEEQRANLLLYSNAFTSAPWVAGANTNVTAAGALSPDGTVNAWKLYASNGLVAAGLRQPITKAASAITYAASVYAKAAGQNWLQVTVFDGTVGNRYWYNISTGAVGTTAAIGAGFTGVSASIVPANNGYYRCVLLATSSTATTYEVYVYPSAADGSNGTGDASNNGVYIYGAQLEAGAFATSYIPTTTSQFTRAADVASVNTLSPWFNAVAGTFYFEGDTAVPASLVLRNLTNMNDGTVNNLHRTYLYNGTVGGSTTTGGVTQADIGGGSYSVNTAFKFAYATAANNFAAVLNGGAPATDALGTMPSGLTTFEIASSFAGTVNTGHIRRITYYPRRLTNAELQTLTTL